ncbi:MAG: hypothetical protein AB1585_16485 [Thermodesulfobacteriota bacterium]
MEAEHFKTLGLELSTVEAFLPVATGFAEKSALALGLGEEGALSLTLATEEIFLYLCQTIPAQKIKIRCRGGGYFVQIEFAIPIEDLNLKAFNLTARIDPEDEGDWQDLGLVLASRSVDRLRIWEEKGQGLHLELTKEKVYPAFQDTLPLPVPPLSRFFLRPPEKEEIKSLARLASEYYPSPFLPPFFRFPGKTVDMAAGGDFKTMVAVDAQGHLGGGILWYWRGPKIVACYGPFLFNQPQDSPMAEALLEALLQEIARTQAMGLLCRYPTPQLPLKHFETLGSFTYFPVEQEPQSIRAYYRHLQEDMGSTVWTHSDLKLFLQQTYRRMVLPREIREIRDYGEKRNPYSVLSTRFDRDRNLVTLYPLRPGADARENLGDYLRLLKKEGWRNIFFEMDLFSPWQVEFVPALTENLFSPAFILPNAGNGDVVLFQALES